MHKTIHHTHISTSLHLQYIYIYNHTRYAAVHQSTSFSSSPQAQAYSRKGEKGDQIWLPLKESLQEKGCGLTTQEMDVIYEVNPIYEMMQRKALSRHPLNPGSSSTSFGPDIDDR